MSSETGFRMRWILAPAAAKEKVMATWIAATPRPFVGAPFAAPVGRGPTEVLQTARSTCLQRHTKLVSF